VGLLTRPLGRLYRPLGRTARPIGRTISPLGQTFRPLGRFFRPDKNLSRQQRLSGGERYGADGLRAPPGSLLEAQLRVVLRAIEIGDQAPDELHGHGLQLDRLAEEVESLPRLRMDLLITEDRLHLGN